MGHIQRYPHLCGRIQGGPIDSGAFTFDFTKSNILQNGGQFQKELDGVATNASPLLIKSESLFEQ